MMIDQIVLERRNRIIKKATNKNMEKLLDQFSSFRSKYHHDLAQALFFSFFFCRFFHLLHSLHRHNFHFTKLSIRMMSQIFYSKENVEEEKKRKDFRFTSANVIQIFKKNRKETRKKIQKKNIRKSTTEEKWNETKNIRESIWKKKFSISMDLFFSTLHFVCMFLTLLQMVVLVFFIFLFFPSSIVSFFLFLFIYIPFSLFIRRFFSFFFLVWHFFSSDRI